MNREECLKSLTVLYVEDDDITRTMVAQILTRWVGKLLLAADGQEGLYLFTRYRPDVVVTDIQMPVMDGLQMSRAIKEMDRDTPVIVTTAFNDQTYFLQAIEIGIDRYLAKPINAEHLMEAIARSGQIMLERRELQQFHEKAEEELKITLHLMRRMMLAKGLKDPGLRYQVQPATRFSGDLVGAARAPDGSLFTLLADATGHGLPAAINLLPLVRVFYKMVEKGFALSSIVAEMNSVLKDQIPPDRFVATSLVRVDTLNHTVEAWNGGNPAMLFVSGAGETLHAFPSGHPPLGILESDAFDARTAVYHWQTPGHLLLYSDGLLEAENAAGEMFGQKRLTQALGARKAPTLFESVLESVKAHLGDKPAHDDISLIAIECRDTIASPPRSS
jgi:serine phosphatase RsbU (regulator of sigma subunit)